MKYARFNIDSALGKFLVFVAITQDMVEVDHIRDAREVMKVELGTGANQVLPNTKSIVSVIPSEAWECKHAKGWGWMARLEETGNTRN